MVLVPICRDKLADRPYAFAPQESERREARLVRSESYNGSGPNL